jgi:hypothetical protein
MIRLSEPGSASTLTERFVKTKAICQCVLALLLLVGMTGCATPYMRDRGRDAADIFTLTVGGLGAGARVRAGPIHCGIIANLGDIGLRGGAIMETIGGICNPNELEFIGYGSEMFCPVNFPDDMTANYRLDTKGYEATSHTVPFVTTELFKSDLLGPEKARPTGLHPYWTQIEMQAGFLVMFRLGFNPGELLDFLLGWAKIDIYKDDLYPRADLNQGN